MNNNLIRIFAVLTLSLLMLPGVAPASVSASGTFTATKSCQAYQSMRKRTNPDGAVLTAGENYTVIEANVPNDTTWYRVEVGGAQPRERWVYFECGDANVSISSGGSASQHGGSSARGTCDIAGEEDSYVFAVSWQPAFCEGHRDKPECKVTDPNSYQAKNFTLHGLWPNKNSCGTNYGFCGKYKKAVRPFCNFDKVPMSAQTLKNLGVVMPSAAYGSCLQRHEWYKHGTCQTEWGADGYFDNAMRLLGEFNGSDGKGLSSFMTKNLGKRVAMDDLTQAIDQQFGAGAHLRMQFSCTNGSKLVDIYISLPAQLGEGSLDSLIQQAPEKFSNKCGNTFVVDRIDD
jgi:ribonuclease T2